MKSAATSVLDNTKHFTTFYPGYRHYSPYSAVRLTLLNTELKEGMNFNGFIDLSHQLPFGFDETVRRITIHERDFRNNVAVYRFSTGDLVTRIRIGLFYDKLPEGTLLDQEIYAVPEEEVPPMPFACYNIPLHFLDFVRTMPTSKFMAYLSRELDVLEATPGMDSTETFEKWAIADKILRLTGNGELHLSYLDWCAKHLFDTYADVKKELGLPEIVV